MISRFNVIPIKIQAKFFCRIEYLILRFIWKGTGARIVKSNLTKKNKVGRITLLDIKSYCVATVIQME